MVLLLEPALQLDDAAEPELRGLLQIAVALRSLRCRARLLQLGLQRRIAIDLLLLLLPVGAHPTRALLQIGELLLELVESLLRGGVGLLLQRGPLDLQLADASLHLVDLDRDRVDLDPEPGGGLVDQVDRLVGEEPARHVAVGQHRGGHERGVLDPDPVMDLVPLLQAPQDRDRRLDGGLLHEHGLEPPLQGGVLLDVRPVLVEGGRTDEPELAASEHRLQQVAGVHRSLGGPRADDRVQLVDERHDLALGVRDLLQDRLQALLELSPVLRAGDHRSDVERDQPLVLQRLRDVAVDDPLREALDDRRLADAGLADQDRVVLRPAREHLDHPADLLVAADHGIELPRAGALGEVAAEPLERLERLLGVLRRDAMAASDLRERGEHRVPGQPRVGEQPSRRAVALQHREEDVLRRDVLVRELLGLAARRLEQTSGGGRQADLDPFGVDLRLRREGLVHRVAELLGDHTQLMQEREDHPFGVGEQRVQDVLRLDLLVVPGRRLLVRLL